jgi:DNA-binding NtrC family response regulator
MKGDKLKWLREAIASAHNKLGCEHDATAVLRDVLEAFVEAGEPAAAGGGRRVVTLRGRPDLELEVREAPGPRRGRTVLVREAERAASGEHASVEHPGSGEPSASAQQRRRGVMAKEMVGDSPAMQQLREFIDHVARGDWTVLIEGETGSGKELVARAVHDASARRDRPFVAVNCAGLTDALLGSQLFGHVRGAFTGATSDRIGYFEAAAGGTLFLDEVGDISDGVQTMLLRALQEREITRVGETRARKVDVRILVATHRNLAERVLEGTFREDLLYRIRVARVRVPPLRDRREDIPLLVRTFLQGEAAASALRPTHVSPSAMELLQRHDWPGNVRELRSAIEHAVIHCRSDCIVPHDLPPEVLGGTPASIDPILEALRRTNGNRTQAARLLGIGRATLYRKLAQ